MLALSAAVEPLRRANQVGQAETFRVRILSWDGRPTPSASGIEVSADDALNLVVPADLTFVCAGDSPYSNIPDALPDHIRLLWRRGKSVGGIAGGTFALAQAGILSGRRFTLHWEHRPVFQNLWPNLEPRQDVYCLDDRIMTCAGEMTSADMILAIIERLCGRDIGQGAMDHCLMISKRGEQDEQTSTIASRLGSRNNHLLHAISWIEQNFQSGLGLDEMYRSVGVSARQLQRLFVTHVGQSPHQYLAEHRLRYGRALLAETDMSILEIATVSGYETTCQFSRAFKKRYGVTPNHFAHFGKMKPSPFLLSSPDTPSS